MKKLSILMVMMMIFTIPISSFGAEKLQINGNKEAVVMESNGVKMFPIRYIAGAYGMELKWNKNLMEASLIYGTKEMIFAANSKEVIVDGAKIKTDQPAILLGGRIYISEMSLQKFFNILVTYKGENAIITMKLKEDIVTVLARAGSFKTLVGAVQSAGLLEAFQGEGPLTIFAPTDGAFENFGKGKLENLLKLENKDDLVDFLTYHVYPRRLTYNEIDKITNKDIEMLNGKMAKITKDELNETYIGSARIISADIEAKNGVIHVVDNVMK